MTDPMGRDKLTGTAVALAGSTLLRSDGATARLPMPIADLAQAVGLAEETGYTGVWVPDHGVWDPFALLTSFIGRTGGMHLATGVVTITDRSPAVTASAGRTVDRISGGRAVVGVGSGPVRRIDRVTAYVDELRDRMEEDVPVYLAAIGPRMVEAAARVADGVLLNWCTPERVRRARREVERSDRRFTVTVYVRACLGHEDGQARRALGEAVAMYASLPSYRRQLESEGLGEAAAAAADAHRHRRIEDVPQSLIDALSVRGGREEAVARIDEYRAAGADLVVVYPVTAQDPSSSLMGTIMAAAPDPSVEA
jgi:5,10-methylenetetrahydromethanopterin reductase